MKYIYLPILLLLSLTSLYSQPENFTSNYDNYNCFAFDDDNYYVGLVNGFVVQERATGDYEYYSTLNSDMVGNNVSDIEVYKGKVYFTTNSGVYSFSDGKVENLDQDSLSFNGIKLDENGYIWFHGNDFLLGYDGENFKYFDLSPFTSHLTSLSEIYIYKEYLWLSIGRYDNRYSYAVININQDTVKSFTVEERGFGSDYRLFLAFSEGIVWNSLSNEGLFKYDIEAGEWSKETNRFILPFGNRIISNIETDESGKMWFIIFDKLGERVYKLATFENDQFVVETKFEKFAADNDITWRQVYKFGDELILSTMSGEYYRLVEDEIELITDIDTNEVEITNETNFYKNGDEIFRLANVKRNESAEIEFIDLENKKVDNFIIKQDTYFPYLTLGSYYKMDGMEFISRYYNNISRVKKDGDWQGVSAIGIVNDDGVAVKIDEKGDYYFHDEYLYKYFKGTSEKLFRFSPEFLGSVDVFDDNVNFYYSYRIGSHDVNYNLQREFGVRISQYDFKGQKTMELTQEDNCISSWYEIGKYSTYYHGSVPSDMKIDNYGNKWCLTWTSLNKIDGNINCTYFNFERDEENEAIKPNQIAYSRYQGKMYGRNDNIVYSFGDTNYRKANSEDMVDGELNFIGESNDGLVYVATTDGRLFRLNTIDSWERIPLIEGKEKIHANIRNVFRSEDTLYVSTEIGLIKVHQKITSVENSSTEELDANVFPNPVGNTFNLTGFEGEAVIYNSFGAKIKSVEITNNDINVSKLPAGIYFITDQSGNPIAKFVKE